MERLVSLVVLVIGLCSSLSVVMSDWCYVTEAHAVLTYVVTYDTCDILWQCTDRHPVYRLAYESVRRCCDGWHGSRCDIAICDPSCPNGGTCIRPGECSCRPGYAPPYCDRIYACDSNPCHHGSCREYHTYYRCSCNSGWQGTTCNIRVYCGHPGSITNGHVSGSGYRYGDRVYFSCNTHYVLVGPTSARCQSNGVWSASKPQCLFGNTCHSNPCQNGATCINGIEQHECVCTEGWSGETCEMDISPPLVDFCPPDQNITTVENRETVSWQPPIFSDFMNETVLVISNYANDEEIFPWGQFVIQYTATKPSNGLRSSCEFTVRVHPHSCLALDPPSNGAIACNGWITRLGRVCKTFCQQGWNVPRGLEDKLDQLYVCGAHGSWLPAATIPCSDRSSEVHEVAASTGFFPGNCTTNDAINSIKTQYLEELGNSSFSKICTSWRDLCMKDNVEVTCSDN